MTRKTLQVVSIGALLILAVAMHVFVHIHLVVLVYMLGVVTTEAL